MSFEISFDTYKKILKAHPDWHSEIKQNKEITVTKVFDSLGEYRIGVIQKGIESHYVVV